MKIRTLFVTAAIATATLTAPAFAWDWELLGTRDVRDAVDRDTIVVEGGRPFDRIRLCVYERPVHFIDVDVHFANGGHQDIQVRARVQAGQCTRAIDLEGDDRNIASVGMVYEANTRRRGVGATVRLYGE
ncbi:MAG: hypothetical protein ABL883_15330 [Terricaulis sp.]